MPVPYIVALAMASSMAMTPAGCPSPFWPSTRPVARSSRATVGSAHGWMYPRRVHSGYFGHGASFSGGQSGDLDAGVLELVATVDGGEHGGDAFERARVGEGAYVDGAEAH